MAGAHDRDHVRFHAQRDLGLFALHRAGRDFDGREDDQRHVAQEEELPGGKPLAGSPQMFVQMDSGVPFLPWAEISPPNPPWARVNVCFVCFAFPFALQFCLMFCFYSIRFRHPRSIARATFARGCLPAYWQVFRCYQVASEYISDV